MSTSFDFIQTFQVVIYMSSGFTLGMLVVMSGD